MCGVSSYNYSDSIPNVENKKGWNYFFKEQEKDYKLNLFVETVRGCNDGSCAYQCQATGEVNKVFPINDYAAVLELFKVSEGLRFAPKYNLIHYGMGDASAYKWGELEAKYPTLWLSGRLNISPNSPFIVVDDLERLGLTADLYLNVNTVEDAKTVNFLQGKISIEGVVLPVNKGIDWIEIFKTLKSDVVIEFNSLTPSWSGNYISTDEFRATLLDELGWEVPEHVKEEKLVAGFKPVVESYELVSPKKRRIVMRRCFQDDSQKIELEMPTTDKKLTSWLWDNEEVYDRLVEWGNSETTCDKCSDVVWYYNYNGYRR